MPDIERDERITDLIGFAVDKKPSEFQQTFNDIVTDRLAHAIDTWKQDLAKDVFNEPPEETEEPETVEVDNEPEEEEENDEES